MNRRNSDAERMVMEILQDEFARGDIRVDAFGSPGSRECCVWLSKGKARVPVIPLRYEYARIDEKKPPRLSDSLEEWQASGTGDLPKAISRAITELRRRTQKLSAV
ncbi:MAG: hypothetical protein GTO55_03120 [Armatimonadetes bacterium]|nr:hypothetical protein [Armatimonadota bacterium]NIM23266.1 hypothetical protein [Armatimonadota bacterium]NIM67134.1 hypothetical protein [Armatimonadota bacterium]NIM75661.1 hypothetical protein [Armatimonadota bacterium]NIN05323.1 hypothetical protein [Armatimonadota bacterium]